MQALNIGIAGLGTVGSSVVAILERRANALALATNRNIRVVSISARASAAVICAKAVAMAVSNASRVRAAAQHRSALIWANASSIGE